MNTERRLIYGIEYVVRENECSSPEWRILNKGLGSKYEPLWVRNLMCCRSVGDRDP